MQKSQCKNLSQHLPMINTRVHSYINNQSRKKNANHKKGAKKTKQKYRTILFNTWFHLRSLVWRQFMRHYLLGLLQELLQVVENVRVRGGEEGGGHAVHASTARAWGRKKQNKKNVYLWRRKTKKTKIKKNCISKRKAKNEWISKKNNNQFNVRPMRCE